MKQRPFILLLALLGALTAVRVLVASRTDLSPDEAYYYAWALKPAAGYLDHPPMVAWLIHAAGLVFGGSEIAVRAPAIAAGFLTPIIIYFVAIEAGAGAGMALAGATAAVLTPLASAGAVIITPDTPLALFWAAATLMLVRIARHDGATPLLVRAAQAAAAGVFVGLAMLSKYTGAMLLLVALVFVPFARDRRRAALWVFLVPALVAAVVYLPNLLYNIGGGFKSMSFQWTHVWGEAGKETFRLHEFLAGQIGVAGPFLCAGVALVAVRFFRHGVAPAERILQVGALLPFFVPLFVSVWSKVEPNWPAPAYLAATPLLAATFGGGDAVATRAKRWVIAAIAYGVLATAVVHIHVLAPFLPIPIDKDPVVQQVYGWREITGNVERIIAQVPDARRRLPATFSYRIAAELYYYSGGRLATLCVDRRFVKGDDLPLAEAARWIAVEQYPAKKADAVMKLVCSKGYQRNGVVANWGDRVLRRLDVLWCD